MSHTTSTVRRLVLVLVVVLPAALSSRAAVAASFRLSSGASFSDVGGVTDFPFDEVQLPIVSPDGDWVVYTHDAQTDGAYELFASPVHGGPPHRLSGLLVSGQRMLSFLFAPDGQRVLYRAEQDEAGSSELYSAPVAAPAGSFVKLNAPLTGGYGTTEIGISADSSQLAYAVHDADFHDFELWVAAMDGSSRQRVVQVAEGGHMGVHRVAPSFSRLVYTADTVVADRFDLWSVPTTGGTPQKLNGALVNGGDVGVVDVSPDSTLVAYTADEQTDDVVEAYVVPIAGGAPVKVSAPLQPGEDVLVAFFLPGGHRILYIVEEPGGSWNLWTVAPDGSDPTRVSGAMQTNASLTGLVWSPDGRRIVYVADQDTDEVYEIYSVAASGGPVVKLNPPLVSGGDVTLAPQITPDGRRVLYVADQEVDGRDELWSVPITGGTAVRVNRTLTPAGAWSVVGFAPAANGSDVFYTYYSRASSLVPFTSRLWKAPVLGGTSVRVDGCTSTNANLFAIPVASPIDARQAFYIADQGADEQYELYAGDDCLFCDGFEGGTAHWVAP